MIIYYYIYVVTELILPTCTPVFPSTWIYMRHVSWVQPFSRHAVPKTHRLREPANWHTQIMEFDLGHFYVFHLLLVLQLDLIAHPWAQPWSFWLIFCRFPRKGRKWPEALHLLAFASSTTVDVVMYNAASWLSWGLRCPWFVDIQLTEQAGLRSTWYLPSVKHTKNHGKSPLFIGKSTINGNF